MRTSIVVACVLLLTALATARVGENEQELVHRYGGVISRLKAEHSTQGRRYSYGEYLDFRADDWSIQALLINGRCERISYAKRGEWTEEQFKHLLEINGGRSQWEEQKNPNPKFQRKWKRRDKTTADWLSARGITIETPVVEKTKQAIEKAAKEEASKLPKF